MEFKILNPELHEIVQQAWRVRQEKFNSVIRVEVPRQTSVISLTGSCCALNCAHCGGHYLKQMTPIRQAIIGLPLKRYKSCLISGGCNIAGEIDYRPHIEEIWKLKDLGYKLNLHVGLIDDALIPKVAQLADCISFDFVIDDETIREVYGLNRSGRDYIEIYQKLSSKVRVLPHICIGLKGGEISGEYQALRELQKLKVEGIVFIVFIPTPGTRYAGRNPVSLAEIIKILATARLQFPQIPIHLGCMRPKGSLRAEIDYYAIECGVNKLVNPTRMAINHARELGLEISFGEECCVL